MYTILDFFLNYFWDLLFLALIYSVTRWLIKHLELGDTVYVILILGKTVFKVATNTRILNISYLEVMYVSIFRDIRTVSCLQDCVMNLGSQYWIMQNAGRPNVYEGSAFFAPLTPYLLHLCEPVEINATLDSLYTSEITP
jgi:hypothetical protein